MSSSSLSLFGLSTARRPHALYPRWSCRRVARCVYLLTVGIADVCLLTEL